MKKISVLLIAALMAGCMMIGCGNSGSGANNNNSNNNNQSSNNNKEEAYVGYVFELKDTKIEMNAKMEELTSKLGKEDAYFESNSCAFQGMDKVYAYGSVVISTYPLENVDYVYTIELKDDTVETPEGIYIGSSLDVDENCVCDVCLGYLPCTDKDGDRICDFCESEIQCEVHKDDNLDAVCDVCEHPTWCTEADDIHRDNNYDHNCNICGIWMSYDCGIDSNGDGRCDDCLRPAFCMEEHGRSHVDEDGDHECVAHGIDVA